MLKRYLPWAALGLLLPATSLQAHEDEKFKQDRQAPYDGPSYRGAAGGAYLGTGSTFPSSGVTLLSWLTLPDLDPLAASGADCWGYVSPSGREYALIGTENGTTVVEVTDPSNAQVIGTIDGPDSLWRDIKIFDEYAYAVSEGGSGIQVIDLTQVDSGIVTLEATVTSGPGTTASHNVAIDEDSGYLYRCGGGSSPIEGIRIYDLANPANPVFVATWNNRYVHDCQVRTFTSGPNAGRQLAYLCAENTSGGGNAGLSIVDVTNKSNLFEVSFTPYSNSAFSHQGWLSPDGTLFYLNDELDESNFGTPTTTRIMDVSNINSVSEAATFSNGNSAIDHNLYTLGNLIFESNYRSGLRVFDASNPLAPVETAFFDTYPSDDLTGFNGLWSVYPYLPSGVVLGSDLERGLFVWWLGDPLVQISLQQAAPTAFNPAGDSFVVNITEDTPGDLLAGSAMLHLDDGNGVTDIPLVDLGGGSYQANVPSFDCGTQVSYWLSAESTNGIVWQFPEGGASNALTASAAIAVSVKFTDDLEAASGWVVGAPGDNATTGIWERVDPNGTDAAPEDDHTDSGSFCFVTGQGSPGGGAGTNDIDNGTTTLLSPTLDLTSYDDPSISYWRWYHNQAGAAPGEDTFVIDISDDNGGSWTNVEIVGPTGAEVSGGWIQHSFVVSDFVTPNDQIVLRFVASDLFSGSVVEAAVDDLEIAETICETPTIALEGDFVLGGDVTIRYLVEPGDYIFAIFGGPPELSVSTPPYDGNLCIAPFFKFFLLPNWNTEEFQIIGILPTDPAFQNTDILFQALVGPDFGIPVGSWTNCAVMHIQ